MEACRDRSMGQLSFVPLVLNMPSCLLWMLYGLPIINPNSIPVTVINLAGFVLTAIYIGIFYTYSDTNQRLEILKWLCTVAAIFVLVVPLIMLDNNHKRRSSNVRLICCICDVFMYGSSLWDMFPSSCSSALVTLAPCLNYVTGSAQEPSQSCCSDLSNVVKTNPVCLCQLFSGGNSAGVNINQTLAMAMPAACKVATPPISACKAVGVPVPPISSPTAPKASSTGSTGSGDKTKPTNTGSSPARVSSAGTFAPTAIGLFLMGLIFSAIPL